MSELVFIQNERVLTTSLKVAEKFEKEHRNVVRDIRVLINQMEGMLKNEHTPFFEESTYTNEQNKQTYPMYLMDFNGFTLLAMGFTGSKALQFKLAYIDAFNKMKETLDAMKSAESHDLSVTKPSEVINEIGTTRDAIKNIFGVKDGIALAEAIDVVENFYGRNLARLKKLIPFAEHVTAYMNATELGAKIGKTARQINKLLVEKGLQVKDENGNYRLTDSGEQYGEMFPYKRNGHSDYQLRWNDDVIFVIAKLEDYF